LYTWPDKPVEQGPEQRYRELLQRRAQGEPVAYLTGRREFWSMNLQVNTATLIPRPETETLVAWALELPLPAHAAVADLGTGSGAIALALARERPAWGVTGLDVNSTAVQLAKSNALELALLHVTFLQSNWFDALVGKQLDLVVANPPYIDAADRHLDQGDVRFEPRSALVADKQGLGDLECIILSAPDYVKPGGWLLLEHGYSQGAEVRDMLKLAGFGGVSTRQDLAGHQRVSGGVMNA